MKIKHLIKILKEENQDLDVLIKDYNNNLYKIETITFDDKVTQVHLMASNSNNKLGI